jgi:S-adenosylhomocysteine hydrolase
VQIADSSLKQVEARYVGTAVACSLVEQLRSLTVSFIGRRIGVLGYGDVGSATARALRGLGAIVAVADASSSRKILAEADGFDVVSTRALFRSSVAVVACTGTCSIALSDIELDRGIVLASGSSRQVEFEAILQEFDFAFDLPSGMRTSRVLRARGRSGTLLLNSGFPINFLGESLPSSIIDLVFAQIALGLAHAQEPGLEPGLHDLTEADLETVATAWLAAYPRHPDSATDV